MKKKMSGTMFWKREGTTEFAAVPEAVFVRPKRIRLEVDDKRHASFSSVTHAKYGLDLHFDGTNFHGELELEKGHRIAATCHLVEDDDGLTLEGEWIEAGLPYSWRVELEYPEEDTANGRLRIG